MCLCLYTAWFLDISAIVLYFGLLCLQGDKQISQAGLQDGSCLIISTDTSARSVEFSFCGKKNLQT